MTAFSQWEEDAFCPYHGFRKMCGCADRPGRSWCSPASHPLTLSQNSLLICSMQARVLASVPVPGAGTCLAGADAGGCKRCGRDADGNGGIPAQGCWQMILSLILPLGLSPTLTSIPFLPLFPPSTPLSSLCSACLSIPYLRLQQRRLTGWLSR